MESIEKEEVICINKSITGCIIERDSQEYYVKIYYTYGFNKIGRKEFFADKKESILNEIKAFFTKIK